MPENPYEPPKEVSEWRQANGQWTWQWGVLIIGSISTIILFALFLDVLLRPVR
jgi:hypothetical protein